MKKIFQVSTLYLFVIYCFADIITTANSLKKELPDGNYVVDWIITNIDFNAFIVIKIFATIIACYSLVYCYNEGFHFTAIVTSFSAVILSTIVVVNNHFATTPGIPKLEPFIILPIQITIILIPLILLIAEAVYKERQVKLTA